MKILYDYQTFYMHKFGGISNCFVQLIKNFPEEVKWEIAACESDNIHLRESGLVRIDNMINPPEQFILKKHFKGQVRLYNEFSKYFPQMTSLGRNRLKSIEALKRGDYDVFHPTFFDGYFLPYLGNKPFVLTVHDMIPELFFGKKDLQVKQKPLLCERAAHIVTVSHKTRQDLIDILGVPPEKISVIYHGGPEGKEISAAPLIKWKYILYVGNREGYKNFIQMVKTIAPLLKYHSEIKLVCTGAPFTVDEKKLFGLLGIENNLIHYCPNDDELRNLYAHALCFIYPSLYEGFGIPILEAWQANCPVMLNYKSCFPEIAQDAAIYFKMDDNTSNLIDVLYDFLTISPDEKDKLLVKQNKRLSFFSWKKSAEKLLSVYNSVL